MINDKQKVSIISKKIKYSTFLDEHKHPSGFYIGKGFIGYIYTIHNQNDFSLYKELYIFINCKRFSEISCTESELQTYSQQTESLLTLWYRRGNFFWLNWESRHICCSHNATEKQKEILIEMKEYYNKNSRGVFFINGPPCSCKSTLLQLLGNEYKCNICKRFTPTEPGDTLDFLYKSVSPSKECPLIILFDEINVIINMVHNNLIAKHKHIPIEIYDTTTYNTFFDDIDDNLYPYLIVLLTTNLNKNEIDKLYHSCYLRQGRVDKYFILE